MNVLYSLLHFLTSHLPLHPGQQLGISREKSPLLRSLPLLFPPLTLGLEMYPPTLGSNHTLNPPLYCRTSHLIL